MSFFNYYRDPFKAITITVIGAGGSGSQFLSALARIVYAIQKLREIRFHVTVYDNDKVSTSNVGRQLFSASEIGMYKADCIVSKINRMYGFEWDSKTHAFELGSKKNNIEPDFYKKRMSNFMITCTDNVESRRFVNMAFDITREKLLFGFKHEDNVGPIYGDDVYCYPFFWIDMGNTKNTGNVIIKSDQSKGLFDYFPDLKDNDTDTPSCSLAEALERQDLFVNTFAANWAAKLLWDILRYNKQTAGGLFYNLETFAVKTIPIHDKDKKNTVSDTSKRGR